MEASSTFQNSSLPALKFQDPVPYFGEYLAIYNKGYGVIHGYLSFIVCIFGITANVLNIIVLSRKNMVSPTNAVLTGLAVSDMLVMFSFLPFTYHYHIREDISKKEKYSYGWAVFTLFHAHFSVVTHAVSVWLTVIVAVWRFIAVRFPAKSATWCTMSKTKNAIIATYVTCAVLCIPIYLTFSLSEVKRRDGEIRYTVSFSQIAERHDRLLEKINFWVFSVITKLVPCVALAALSFGLIRVLYKVQKRKQRLQNGKTENDTCHDRITKMILAVLLLFLLTEFPSGLLALLSGILGRPFFINVYLNFGETMDALALINSAINFIIYCSMSRQFRYTFVFLFVPKCMKKHESAQIEMESKTDATTFV